jgi:ferredoxin
MTTEKYVETANLGSWLEDISQDHKVMVPMQEGEVVLFRPYDSKRPIVTDKMGTASTKSVLFPQSEALLQFNYTKDPEDPSKVLLDVHETLPVGRTVVFGSRPCDVRGVTMFDRVYLEGKKTDIYYKMRRDQTVFITLACEEPEETCFCNWVGSSPCDDEGSDVLAIPLSDGFFLRPVTERGEELLASHPLSDGAPYKQEAEEYCRQSLGTLEQPPDLAEVPKKIMALFNDGDFWQEVSAKCLNCGICSYLCPSCYCFNITDETVDGNNGKRVRSWDNCMSAQFTMEASGHNPRSVKSQRLKNRVGHKFSYYPALHDDVISCVGCGRCIKSCPAGVDIREIVLQAMEHRSAALEVE